MLLLTTFLVAAMATIVALVLSILLYKHGDLSWCANLPPRRFLTAACSRLALPVVMDWKI